MPPRSLRKWAVAAGIVGVLATVLGLANVIAGFSSNLVTILALVAGGASVGLALEIWYVSRRIERQQRSADTS